MIICLASVMHTGTRVIEHDVLWDFHLLGTIKSISDPKDKDVDVMYRGHVTDTGLPKILEWIRTFKTVIPLRHPARCWKSFSDRKMQHRMYIEQWNNLINIVDNPDISYVVIDSPNRDTYVEQLGIDIGRKLDPKWPVSKMTTDFGNHDAEITSQLMAGVPRHIMDFYESKRIYG